LTLTLSKSGSNEFMTDISKDFPSKNPERVNEEIHADISILKKIKSNEHNLKRSWEISSNFTKDDWNVWHKRLSLKLFHESPSPALRFITNINKIQKLIFFSVLFLELVFPWPTIMSPSCGNYLMQLL
jgi:hypothetical protein